MAAVEPTPENIRQIALGLLARREHSRLELRRKLQRRFPQAVVLDQVLDDLEAGNYLSDQRYAESMTRSRSGRGYGPLRVRAELTGNGVGADMVSQALHTQETDWVCKAKQALRKRFGVGGIDGGERDLALRGKQYRFLAQRGFNADQIRAALDAYEARDDSE